LIGPQRPRLEARERVLAPTSRDTQSLTHAHAIGAQSVEALELAQRHTMSRRDLAQRLATTHDVVARASRVGVARGAGDRDRLPDANAIGAHPIRALKLVDAHPKTPRDLRERVALSDGVRAVGARRAELREGSDRRERESEENGTHGGSG